MILDPSKFSGPCSCGKIHTVAVKGIYIEKGAVKRLPILLRREGFAHPFVVCDSNTEIFAPAYHRICLPAAGLHADEHAVAKTEEALPFSTDVLLAVGSGTIHDITRYVAYKKGLPFFSVPTAASVDGFVSTVAAMTWYGFKKSFPSASPVYVVADTDIFAKAPYRLTASGISDLMGKHTAVADWEIAARVTGEHRCPVVCAMEKDALTKAETAIPHLHSDPSACEVLMEGLLLSGLAMQMMGNSRPASGAEHHLSHLWEMEVINPHIEALHGEKVSVGLLLCLERYQALSAAIKRGSIQVVPFQEPDTALLYSLFKNEQLYQQIIKENTPNPLSTISPSQIEGAFPAICEIIDARPTAQHVYKVLNRAGCKTTPHSIGLDDACIPTSMALAPYVRNRLTFLRLSKMLQLK